MLLAEAGYPDGFETTMIGPVGRYTKDKEMQEAIAGMLSEVGVTITHVQPEWAQFIQQWLGEEFPMYYIGTGNQVLDCDQHLGYRIDGARYNRYYTNGGCRRPHRTGDIRVRRGRSVRRSSPRSSKGCARTRPGSSSSTWWISTA